MRTIIATVLLHRSWKHEGEFLFKGEEFSVYPCEEEKMYTLVCTKGINKGKEIRIKHDDLAHDFEILN